MSKRVEPHDQPQTMCPAFGSLRVGLRMRRTAMVLVGSSCCVYGLSFTSHFYGARRSVGYVPFNSESLVTGTLFEEIRAAVHQLADPERYDAVVVINLCVPTASGEPLRLLPEAINGVRIVPLEVPGFGVTTHAEAKDLLAAATLRYARYEAESGPVRALRSGRVKLPTVALLGEMFPGDPVNIGRLLEPMGLAAGQVVPTREWRELYAALDCQAVAAIHPFYTHSLREFEEAGRPQVPSAPVGYSGTEAWLEAVGEACGIDRKRIDAAKDAALPAMRKAIEASPIRGKITLSGYEGSELLVARLLVECGADVRFVGTTLPKTPWSEPDRAWLEARGIEVQYRVNLQQEVAALEAHRPDLVISTDTPAVQRAKELSIPGSYYTNLIPARPMFGPAGPGAIAEMVNSLIASKERFNTMTAFFGDVGKGGAGGIWVGRPPREVPNPEGCGCGGQGCHAEEGAC